VGPSIMAAGTGAGVGAEIGAGAGAGAGRGSAGDEPCWLPDSEHNHQLQQHPVVSLQVCAATHAVDPGSTMDTPSF
jgi:hypothetical protein